MTRMIEALWLLFVVACFAVLAAALNNAYSMECIAKPDDKGQWTWRQIDGRKCWYRGKRVIAKSELHWPKEKKEVVSDKHSNTNRPETKPHPAPPARAESSVKIVNEGDFNELDAQANELPKFYPTLMPSAVPPASLMLNPMASTKWQSITDPDVMILFAPWELRAGGAFAR